MAGSALAESHRPTSDPTTAPTVGRVDSFMQIYSASRSIMGCSTPALPVCSTVPPTIGRPGCFRNIDMDLRRTILAASLLALGVTRPNMGAEAAPSHGTANERLGDERTVDDRTGAQRTGDELPGAGLTSDKLTGDKLTGEVFTDLAEYLDIRFGKNTDDLPELRSAARDPSSGPESDDHSMVPLPPAVSSAISLGAAYLSVRGWRFLRKNTASRRPRTLL